MHMGRNSLKLAWLCFVCCFVAGYVLLFETAQDLEHFFAYLSLSIVATLCLFYIVKRAISFRKNFINLFKNLIAGNYDA